MDYSCASCGYATAKWMGFCPQCRSSGTMVEGAAVAPMPITQLAEPAPHRLPTGVGELDRVLGGGLVAGSVVLLAGEPGVGKSTLVLGAGAATPGHVLLVSGEESVGQVRLRAERIGALADSLSIVAARDAAEIGALISSGYDLVVVDSIQTVTAESSQVAAGGPAQVRGAAAQLIGAAKESGTALILTGHVTKEGSIAGPKVQTLIEGRDPEAAGSVLFPTVDGLRSLVVEIQALVIPSPAPQPRRSVKGLPAARVHQILAALERHAEVPLGGHEVYVSAMGGLRVAEPAADLAVALAVASAASGVAISDVAAWGEVGLTGELRGVPHAARRRSEVGRLGIGGVIEGQAYPHLLDALVDAGLAAATVAVP